MDLFTALAVVLGVAAVGGVAARILRQPAIVGYIAAGLAISTLGFLAKIDVSQFIQLMGKLGVTLLLFLVGLELPISQLKRMGKPALITGIGQILVTSFVGLTLARLLGFAWVQAAYLGIALTFGSTVIVVNLLAVKKDLQSLYGRLTVGYLLVQDFVAIGILVFLSGVSRGDVSLVTIFLVILKGLVLLAGAVWLSDKLLHRVLNWLGKSSEILFVVSLGWCLVIAALVASPWIGFSVEMGGFLAGLALASVSENLSIISKVRPLRDFFMVLFFVALGGSISFAGFWGNLGIAAIFSIFVLVGNPVILMVILGLQGFKKHISFMTGVTVSQVSEFSLIVLAMALAVGQVDQRVVSIVGLVSLITMVGSTYMITYSDKIYRHLSKYLGAFEFRVHADAAVDSGAELRDHVVLFGHNRVGGLIRPTLQKLGTNLVVVDFDPQVLESLLAAHVTAMYGDISDWEVYDQIKLDRAKLVVSTVSELSDNLQLLKYLKGLKPLKSKPVVVTLASDNADAKILYAAGADYVLVPHSVGGEYLESILQDFAKRTDSIIKKGQAHYQRLCA